MPKCASNSIEAMLKPHSDIQLSGSSQVRHTNVRNFKIFIEPYLVKVAGLDGVESICLVREPVSWLNSWYRFRARHELRATRNPRSTAHISFEDFVRAFLSEPRPPFAQFGTQFDFVRDAEGKVGVDRLFGYNDMEGVVEFFSRRIGRRLQIRTLNVSPVKVHASGFIERADALKRRLLQQLPLSRPPEPPAQRDVGLPADLYAQLRAAIPRDFELYENFT